MFPTTPDSRPDSVPPPEPSGRVGLDWQGAYEGNRTPWDLRGPTAPLRRLRITGFFAGIGLPDQARVAVPMCGRGHDLRLFTDLGHQVTGFDIAPSAIREAAALQDLNTPQTGNLARLLVRDVLGLTGEYDGEFTEAFDLVYDYTSFCALPTHLRGRYVSEMSGILATGGQLLMLAFPMRKFAVGPTGRPPFLVSEADLEAATAPHFERLASFAAEDSPPDRAGAERWFHYRKRA